MNARRLIGIGILVMLLSLAFHNGARACTADDADPADTGWTIQCSNTET